MPAAATVLVVSVGSPPVPLHEMRVADHAIRVARRPDIRRWAPERVELAEIRLETARRRQIAAADRWFPRKELESAAAGFDEAHRLACTALREAAFGRRRAVGDATLALSEAREALADAEAAARLVEPQRSERASLFRARVAIEDSRAHASAGDHLSAVAAATRAEQGARSVLTSLLERARRYQDRNLLRIWEGWAEETIADSRRRRSRAILVVKERNELVVLDSGRAIARFPADMGYNSTARKLHSGDRATPEGRYRISARKDVGQSIYYRAFLLDYPNPTDRERLRGAVAAGSVRRGAAPGGAIEIHGDGGRGKDWTDGCVALANSDMDRLFRLVGIGTPVTIVGAYGEGGKFSDLVDRHDSSRIRSGS